MVVQSPPRPPTTTVRTTYEEPYVPRESHDDHSAAWAFVWILFAFKMATVFMIWWASKSYATTALLAATTWFWLAIPAVALAGPIAFRLRLRQVRKRRDALRRAEWLLDAPSPAPRRSAAPGRPRA